MSGDGPWVIIEFNQASNMPSLANGEVYARRIDAETDIAGYREDAAQIGRRERYVIAEIDMDDEDDL